MRDLIKIDKRERDFAYYWAMGYTPKNAMYEAGFDPEDRSLLNELTRSDVLKAYKKALQAEIRKQANLGTDYLISFLVQCLEFDIVSLMDAGTLTVNPEKVHELPDHLRRFITGVEPTRYGPKLKLLDKKSALQLLGQILQAKSGADEDPEEEQIFAEFNINVVEIGQGLEESGDSDK